MIYFPISIVEKNGDTVFYHSLQEAEVSVESIDVLNHEYEVFDASGKRLHFLVEKEKRKSLFGLLSVDVDVVKIKEAP